MKKVVFLLLVFMGSICSASEFWLVGNYPTLDVAVYGMGDPLAVEAQDSISRYKGDQKFILYSASMFVGATALSGNVAAGLTIVYFGPKFMDQSKKKWAAKDKLVFYQLALANMLTKELSGTSNGQNFIDTFGPIVDVETDFYGKIKTFKTGRNLVFKRQQGDDGITFFQVTTEKEVVNLFIEPNL